MGRMGSLLIPQGFQYRYILHDKVAGAGGADACSMAVCVFDFRASCRLCFISSALSGWSLQECTVMMHWLAQAN